MLRDYRAITGRPLLTIATVEAPNGVAVDGKGCILQFLVYVSLTHLLPCTLLNNLKQGFMLPAIWGTVYMFTVSRVAL